MGLELSTVEAKTLRGAIGLSSGQLGLVFNCDAMHVNRWESDSSKETPTPWQIERMLDILKLATNHVDKGIEKANVIIQSNDGDSTIKLLRFNDVEELRKLDVEVGKLPIQVHYKIIERLYTNLIFIDGVKIAVVPYDASLIARQAIKREFIF
jgi:hypothetical protein